MAASGRVLAVLLMQENQPTPALIAARTALRHAVDDFDTTSALGCTVVVARALAATGDLPSAAILADGIRSWANRVGQRWDAADRGTLGDLDTVLEAGLKPAERRTANERGSAMSLAELIALATAVGTDDIDAVEAATRDTITVPMAVARGWPTPLLLRPPVR